MSESNSHISSKKKQGDSKTSPKADSKAKPELKPFNEFINDDFIPGLSKELVDMGIEPDKLLLERGKRPVTGDTCWMVLGEIDGGRRFWLCFNSDKITSDKTLAIAERGSVPSVLESFLIDEKKTTCALLISRLLQRLNGQKWLGAN